MPHKPDRLGWTLPPAADRRRKLTPEQREAIGANPEGLSQRALAAQYGISRRMVQFILTPAKHCRQPRGKATAWRLAAIL